MKPISIQLYTVREAAAADFFGTLEAIAEIGYKGVEPAGLHGYDPREIAKVVSDLGMTVTSSHTGVPDAENVCQMVDVEKTLGNTRIISSSEPDDMQTLDQVKSVAEKFQTAAQLVKPFGMTFGFHNHWWEFRKFGDKYAYEILLEEAPDAFSELDVYWTAYAGVDPVSIISRYKSRIPLLHIKDGSLKKDSPMTAVGKGNVNIPDIIDAAEADVDWLIVELDECATDMMQAVRDSYEYLISNGLAVGNK